MAPKSDENRPTRLDELTPRNDALVRGGDADAKNKKGVSIGSISIVKTFDKASPSL
jgi:hypothetical protein